MNYRTITLPADLVERFELLANQHGRSLDELLTEILNNYSPASGSNWALCSEYGVSEHSTRRRAGVEVGDKILPKNARDESG